MIKNDAFLNFSKNINIIIRCYYLLEKHIYDYYIYFLIDIYKFLVICI